MLFSCQLVNIWRIIYYWLWTQVDSTKCCLFRQEGGWEIRHTSSTFWFVPTAQWRWAVDVSERTASKQRLLAGWRAAQWVVTWPMCVSDVRSVKSDEATLFRCVFLYLYYRSLSTCGNTPSPGVHWTFHRSPISDSAAVTGAVKRPITSLRPAAEGSCSDDLLCGHNPLPQVWPSVINIKTM